MMHLYTASLLVLLMFTGELISDQSDFRDLAKLSRDVFNFGLSVQNELITEMDPENLRNIVISPIGLVGALALVQLGSVGETREELAGVLGFSKDIRSSQQNHKFLADQLEGLKGVQLQNITTYANAMFVNNGFKVRDVYQKYIETVYSSGVFNVDFANNPTEAREFINRWVEKHTNGKIKELLVKNLPTITKLVMASALYFKASWQIPFIPSQTQSMAFTPDINKPEKEEMVETMININMFSYFHSTKYGCDLIALPYRDGTATFYAIKPRGVNKKTLVEFLKDVNADIIEEIINSTEVTHTVVCLPKMNLTTVNNLVPTLQALGVNALFKPGVANLALIADKATEGDRYFSTRGGFSEDRDDEINALAARLPNPGLYVDEIIHKVNINIDEYGTEGAAGTAIFAPKSAKMFRAVEPFMFFIKNENTKLITFSAVIFNPNLK